MFADALLSSNDCTAGRMEEIRLANQTLKTEILYFLVSKEVLSWTGVTDTFTVVGH